MFEHIEDLAISTVHMVSDGDTAIIELWNKNGDYQVTMLRLDKDLNILFLNVQRFRTLQYATDFVSERCYELEDKGWVRR